MLIDRMGPDSDDLAALQAELRAAAQLPLERARMSPPQVYTDPEFHEWEVANVLRKDWLCVCHVSQIPRRGDYYNLDLLGEPLTVVHGKDGVVRTLSRTCPHRAADIMAPGEANPSRGHRRIFICPYHRWTFELDGRAKGCPEMHRAEDFNKREWQLAEYRTEVWHGFVFLNLSGDAEPVPERYAALGSLMERAGAADLQVAIELEWDTRANWKVITENWIESYHHVGTHLHTLNPMMPAQDTWVEPEDPHVIRCHLPYRDSVVDEIRAVERRGEHYPGFLPLPGLTPSERTEWSLCLGLPSFMFLVVRDRVIWYRADPLGPNRTRWLTTTLVSAETATHPTFEAWLRSETEMLREFHLEDLEVVEAVQRGLASEKAQQGRLSHLDEPVWLIQRWLAARTEDGFPGEVAAVPAHHGAGRPAVRYGARESRSRERARG
jgi:phenylpropionate dioxygenase-like ring-hydroxylating dioxygenase large terminal subunit